MTYIGGTTYFDHTDWLGTVRARSNVSGTRTETCTSLAFGDNQSCAGTDESPQHFASLEWDTESGLQYAWFRQLSTTEGRWATPDPAGLAAVDPTNPQSWNRYAYAINSPLNFVDPLGLKYVLVCTPIEDGGQVCDWYDDGSGDGTPPPNQGGRSGGGTNNQQPITCDTVLPDGSTVGSQVAALSNKINDSLQLTSTPYGPIAQNGNGSSIPSVVSEVYNGTNFRAMYGSPGANYVFLGDAGNFAYGAVTANIGVPLWTAEMVGGVYAFITHPAKDRTGLSVRVRVLQETFQRGMLQNAKDNGLPCVLPDVRIMSGHTRTEYDGSGEWSLQNTCSFSRISPLGHPQHRRLRHANLKPQVSKRRGAMLPSRL
jgi:RHS repeat-associated protein